MAGFGGLFDYNKPGPGVDKNAPKKKGIALFFEILGGKFFNLIPLSLLYWLFCLPIVTVGFADVGLAYITRNFAREKPVLQTADFFDTIKKNWKQALPVGFINFLLTALMIFGMSVYLYLWEYGFVFKVGFVITGCMFIVFSFMKYYINFLMVTFDLKFKQLYKNSLLLSSVGLKENLIISAWLIGIYGLLIGLPLVWMAVFENAFMALVGLLIFILFVPALQALIIQFCVFPVVKKHMIDPYYEEHPEAKKDKALLNLFDDEEEETDGEGDVLFTDHGSNEHMAPESESSIPRQYSKKDIKRIRRERENDDDDTI